MALLLITACGRRIDPEPPYAVRPVPPKDVRIFLYPWGAEVHFKIPREKVNGHPLDGLKGFKIMRLGEALEGPKALYKKEFFLPLKGQWGTIKEFRFKDRDLLSGVRYRYRIRAVRGWHCQSDAALSPAFAWHTPPKPPRRLFATAGDGEVCLKWTPVKAFLDDSPVSGGEPRYRLYRFTNGQAKLLPVLTKDTSFCDKGLPNERTYCYQVAAVFIYFGTEIQGPLSPKACARPEDRTPPRAPEGLVAVPVKGGVLLRWYRNGELDLAGYRVYRRRPGEPPKLLTKKLLKEPKYLDRSLPGPGLYYYWVTAVDSSPRANESSPSEIVEVEISPQEDQDAPLPISPR